jgi:diguanylate cyclase (GGDEF)-like protein
MPLDPATLTVVFVLLSGVLGILLLFAWTLNRKVSALAWWGSSFCLIGSGIGLGNLGAEPVRFWVLLVANALGLLAYGAVYAGCKIFNGRRGVLLASTGGAAAWALAYPFIYGQPGARLVAVALITGVYSAASVWELWRHASPRLASQWVAIVLLLLLAAFNLWRGLLAFSLTSIPWLDAFSRRWSTEMALSLVVFGPTLAFIFLSMAKERVEHEYKQAAFIDPLTGMPNRRAFMQNAARLLARCGDQPFTCMVFDLDNFKSINDRYGHTTGDRILSLFGRILADHLPRNTFGRLGGEEFAAVVPMGSLDAVALANAIRHAFSSAGAAILGDDASGTVSVGCATAAHTTVEDLLHRADAALYEAKDGGRNIVITADLGSGPLRQAINTGAARPLSAVGPGGSADRRHQARHGTAPTGDPVGACRSDRKAG